MNTNEAFKLLKDAGVTNSIQTLRRWIREGVIKATRTENRKAGFRIDEDDLQRFIDERTGRHKDNRIKELEQQIKSYEEYMIQAERERQEEINKLEQELKETKKRLNKYQNRNKKSKIDDILDNIENLKEYTKRMSEQDYDFFANALINNQDYHQKLGLSSNATDDEIRKAYRELLNKTHPDRGGDKEVFNYIKKDYENFKQTNRNTLSNVT